MFQYLRAAVSIVTKRLRIDTRVVKIDPRMVKLFTRRIKTVKMIKMIRILTGIVKGATLHTIVG